MFDFNGDIVWVTGSASGIGHATALLFAEHGADVVVHGLNQRAASEALADRIRGMGRRALVSLRDRNPYGRVRGPATAQRRSAPRRRR